MKPASLTKKKKKTLSKEEKDFRKIQVDHRTTVRRVFENASFVRFPKLADREFVLDQVTKSDFDDIFIYENLIVCIEYTAAKSVGAHLKPKKIVYDKINVDQKKFLEVLFALDSDFRDSATSKYSIDELLVKIVYCSRYEFESKYKLEIPNPIYLDYPELRYFASVSDCIKNSCIAEIIDFLKVSPLSLGSNGQISTTQANSVFEGSLLPESNSNYETGYKVVTFYADPESLLRRAYVLRRQGWRDSEGLYQRMISKTKIEAIRKHLKIKKRVFVNNIIATLDADTKILDGNGNTVDHSTITKTEQVRIQIPDRSNTVGLIDGQHRTFSYYASSPDDPDIAKLRKKQNLLVTGIIYPQNVGKLERETFEARLFLEINSTQTNAESSLKQAINSRLEPFSDESIAKSVLDRLARGSGPLAGHVERYWFDVDKLKTTSVVSYGLKPLVKTSGEDSLYSAWSEQGKNDMVRMKDEALLGSYIDFCAFQIDQFLIAVKKQLPVELWTPSRLVKGRLISTTTVNSLLIWIRLIISKSTLKSENEYALKLRNLTETDFSGFHSSQYGRMAEKLHAKYLI